MKIQSLLTPSRTRCGIVANSKRQALEILAATVAQDIPSLDADDLFRRFLARERLGSTGVGNGIAIPHCGVDKSSDNNEAYNKAIGALITLAQPVNFDAIDSQPVDILFAMLVPEASHEQHLQNLAALAGAMNNEHFRQSLRDANSDEELYQAATLHHST